MPCATVSQHGWGSPITPTLGNPSHLGMHAGVPEFHTLLDSIEQVRQAAEKSLGAPFVRAWLGVHSDFDLPEGCVTHSCFILHQIIAHLVCLESRVIKIHKARRMVAHTRPAKLRRSSVLEWE